MLNVRTEHHYFELPDPLLRKIHITITDTGAKVEYFFTLPHLEPFNRSNRLFAASYGENFLSVDLDNKALKVDVVVDPETATKLLQIYGSIALSHSKTTTDTD